MTNMFEMHGETNEMHGEGSSLTTAHAMPHTNETGNQKQPPVA